MLAITKVFFNVFLAKKLKKVENAKKLQRNLTKLVFRISSRIQAETLIPRKAQFHGQTHVFR